MGNINHIYRTPWLVYFSLLALLLLPSPSMGEGDEVTSFVNRYGEHEVSTGYYEKYEVRPRHENSLVTRFRGAIRKPFSYTSTAATVRNRNRLADSHRGIKFYNNRRCEECHKTQTHDIHTTRANLSCRQCHGAEPIASINHYYSPMNPIRRHAYVCAKCHEGSSASFASYVIHEPVAGDLKTKTTFPALYYSYWLMLGLLVFTLAFFIPHSILLAIREMIKKRKG
jgi:hypothetical protein